jgi:hypothetical protein
MKMHRPGSNATAEQLLKAVLKQTREPLHTIDHLTSFLLDPSAGQLTQHQKSIVMKIANSARDIQHHLDEASLAYQRAKPISDADQETGAEAV